MSEPRQQPVVAVLGTGIMGAAMARSIARAGLEVRAWNRSRAKAEPLAAERGIAFVDAPVLGTRQPAEQGALTVLAAGTDALRDRAAPVFDAIGSRTIWLGEVGTATRMKLVANAWLLTLTSALGESLTLARALGLPPEQFLELLDGASYGTPYAQLKGRAMLAHDLEPPSFPAKHAEKDARLVVDAAEAGGLDLELARTVMNLYGRITALGYGDEDMAAVVKAATP